MAHGKPKDAKATIKRMLTYVGKYKLHLLLVVLCGNKDAQPIVNSGSLY